MVCMAHRLQCKKHIFQSINKFPVHATWMKYSNTAEINCISAMELGIGIGSAGGGGGGDSAP